MLITKIVHIFGKLEQKQKLYIRGVVSWDNRIEH